MTAIDDLFFKTHPLSLETAAQAKDMFPDGVTHDIRYISPFPIYMQGAKEGIKWDIDGNRYIDYVIGHGALILGHGRKEVVDSLSSQLKDGTHLGGSTKQEIQWAKEIINLVPCAEKVRFVASGTEASLMALRLARAYTGKDKVIKFAYHFHGWHDYLILGEPRGVGGVPSKVAETVVVLEPTIEAVERTLEQDNDIACVILEPTGAHGGQLPVQPAFLKALRSLTEKHNVVLIFDEVVTGFRVSKGGAQLRYGVTPDMSTHAKILAGGLPGGAVVGKKDLLDMIQHRGDANWDSQKRVAHPGTFNANPLSSVAGAAALNIIANEPINERCDILAERLKSGINDVLTKNEIDGFAYGVSSIVFIGLGIFPEFDSDGICLVSHNKIRKAADPSMVGALRKALLNEGIDTQGGRVWRLSAAHTETDIDESIGSFEKAIDAVRRDGFI
jgi:glutamate-1-semialdehyde 2,1-aminomutase